MAYGALIEGLITLLSRLVALESGNWSTELSISANAITTTILVLAGNNLDHVHLYSVHRVFQISWYGEAYKIKSFLLNDMRSEMDR